MVYQKACEIDPTEKRKKPVIVTEVYDPPLPAETDRGRSGEYIKLLRPLLLLKLPLMESYAPSVIGWDYLLHT